MNNVEPTHTSMCVRSPAAHALRRSRSKPTKLPSSAATSRRIRTSSVLNMSFTSLQFVDRMRTNEYLATSLLAVQVPDDDKR